MRPARNTSSVPVPFMSIETNGYVPFNRLPFNRLQVDDGDLSGTIGLNVLG
jgi:hypothetical protein